MPFDSHQAVKDQLLTLIEQIEPAPLSEVSSIIAKSNWQQSTLDDGYWQLIAQDMQKALDSAASTIGYEAKIASQWFQQYLKHGTHAWHTHPGSDLSIVYYLELPPYTATEFLDAASGKISSYPVQEGDIAIFPSVLIHRSPVNRTPGRKTVIAMNARASNYSTEMHY